MTKALIIGQGLAGSVLAWTLEKRGVSVTVADAGEPGGASLAAAGIVNPVTGKRYVKSWRFDDFFPFAQKIYREIECELGLTLWHERPIFRLLTSVEEENNWSSRCGLADYSDFIGLRKDAGEWSSFLKTGFFFGEIKQAAQLNLPLFLSVFRKKLLENGQFLQKNISLEEIEKHLPDFDFIVFCEGFRGRENQFFPNLAWQPAKGEALLGRFENPAAAQISSMLKKKIMLAPMGGGLFWAGANYDWDFADDQPTTEGKSFVINELGEMLDARFEICGHLSAIRPTVKDRRPMLGFSQKNPSFGIFNGLGTKGVLLSPFLAAHFADHVLDGRPLWPDVDVCRFG